MDAVRSGSGWLLQRVAVGGFWRAGAEGWPVGFDRRKPRVAAGRFGVRGPEAVTDAPCAAGDESSSNRFEPAAHGVDGTAPGTRLNHTVTRRDAKLLESY